MPQKDDEFKHHAKLEEYKALREEQMHSLRYRVWGFASYAILSGGLFALSTKSEVVSNLAYLAIVFLALPYLHYTTYVIRMDMRISAYLKVVIEPSTPGLNWERALEKWRGIVEKPGRKLFVSRCSYIFSVTGIYVIIAFLASLLVFINAEQGWVKIVDIIALMFVILSLFRLNKVLNSGKVFKEAFKKYLDEKQNG